MESSQVKLLSDRISISGEYFTVSSGFISKANGEIQLKYKDLLTVELVKRRSKKLMYVALFMGSILVFAVKFKLDAVIPMAYLIILTLIVCAAGIMYLVSVQRFVEITSMCGTYRIPVGREDFEMENVVMLLNKQIFK